MDLDKIKSLIKEKRILIDNNRTHKVNFSEYLGIFDIFNDNIHKKTLHNLLLLKDFLKISWTYSIPYLYHPINNRKGRIIYGICNNTNNIIVYHRCETPKGGTFLEMRGGKLRISTITHIISTNQDFLLDGDDYKKIKHLYDKTKSQNLEKFIFQHL